jgi:hypothetical protein
MATTTPDRVNILKGPAKLVWNSATIIFGEDFSVDLITEWFDVTSSTHGRVGRRVKDRRIEIKGAPLMWDTLSALYPYATHNIGDVLFGSTDKPAVITPRNGAPLTVANVMPTSLAPITCHPSKSMLGSMTFTGLVANASDPSLAASFFSFGSVGTNVALTGLDTSKIPNAFYTATLNSVTYRPADGFGIDFNLGLEPDMDNGLTINQRITSLECSAKFVPGPHTEAAIATLLGWGGKQPGDEAGNYPLVITGDGTGKPVVTLANMMVVGGGVRYGRQPRAGEITLESVRQVTSGNLTALWVFSTAA